MFLSIPALKFLGQIPRTIQARAKFLTMLKWPPAFKLTFPCCSYSDIVCSCWALGGQWTSDDSWTPMQTSGGNRKKTVGFKLDHLGFRLGSV
jgi:hypothetical protein